MKLIYQLFAVAAALCCAGCDKENDINYLISNKTDDTLYVGYRFLDSYFARSIVDSTVFVPGHTTIKLFTHVTIAPSVYNVEQEKTTTFIRNMTVIRTKDQAQLRKDASATANWMYHKTARNKADYEFMIEASDF